MTARKWIAVVAGTGVVVFGAVTVVFLLQPWRSCEYEDTAFGCARLAGDADLMLAAGFATLVCVAAFFGALSWKTVPRR